MLHDVGSGARPTQLIGRLDDLGKMGCIDPRGDIEEIGIVDLVGTGELQLGQLVVALRPVQLVEDTGLPFE